MLVTVTWSEIAGDTDPLWQASFCLYAYLHPTRNWLLYIGKADYATVRERLRGYHKDGVFRDIHRAYGIDGVGVLHGELELPPGSRRSSALLADVESLLIKRLEPYANIQSKKVRIARPGLRVECFGDWPYSRARFWDR